jgi:ActR/RegA family two-component response regulator
MLVRKSIMIAEDKAFLALDLALEVENLDGVVVGPVASVADALVLIDTVAMAGAVVDCQLADRDATPLVMALVARAIPVVIQTGTALPAGLALLQPRLPVLRKPVQPLSVLAALVVTMDAKSNITDQQ